MSDSFTVPGNPVPKARPRVVNGHAYTPAKTELAEAWVAMHARKAKVRWTEAPVFLRLRFYRKDAVPCDLDNLVKTVCDALNGIAWKDDRQILQLVAEKSIDRENPRTEVEILGEVEARQEAAKLPAIEEDLARAVHAWGPEAVEALKR